MTATSIITALGVAPAVMAYNFDSRHRNRRNDPSVGNFTVNLNGNTETLLKDDPVSREAYFDHGTITSFHNGDRSEIEMPTSKHIPLINYYRACTLWILSSNKHEVFQVEKSFTDVNGSSKNVCVLKLANGGSVDAIIDIVGGTVNYRLARKDGKRYTVASVSPSTFAFVVNLAAGDDVFQATHTAVHLWAYTHDADPTATHDNTAVGAVFTVVSVVDNQDTTLTVTVLTDSQAAISAWDPASGFTTVYLEVWPFKHSNEFVPLVNIQTLQNRENTEARQRREATATLLNSSGGGGGSHHRHHCDDNNDNNNNDATAVVPYIWQGRQGGSLAAGYATSQKRKRRCQDEYPPKNLNKLLGRRRISSSSNQHLLSSRLLKRQDDDDDDDDEDQQEEEEEEEKEEEAEEEEEEEEEDNNIRRRRVSSPPPPPPPPAPSQQSVSRSLSQRPRTFRVTLGMMALPTWVCIKSGLGYGGRIHHYEYIALELRVNNSSVFEPMVTNNSQPLPMNFRLGIDTPPVPDKPWLQISKGVPECEVLSGLWRHICFTIRLPNGDILDLDPHPSFANAHTYAGPDPMGQWSLCVTVRAV